MSKRELTARERMAMHILFWILRMLNPTGYAHQIDILYREVMNEAERAKREGSE